LSYNEKVAVKLKELTAGIARFRIAVLEVVLYFVK